MRTCEPNSFHFPTTIPPALFTLTCTLNEKQCRTENPWEMKNILFRCMIVRHLKPRRRKVQFKSQLKFKTCWFSESTFNMMRSLVAKNNLVLYFLINMNLCIVIFRVLNKIVAFLFHFTLIHFKKCSTYTQNHFETLQILVYSGPHLEKRACLCKLHVSMFKYSGPKFAPFSNLAPIENQWLWLD